MSSGESRAAVSPDGGNEIHVGVAEFGVATDGAELVTNGVGSCLAVGLYDDAAGVGGLAHPMLPERTSDRGPDGKYVASGLDRLLAAVREAGASRGSLVAKLAGGASILSSTGAGVGQRNVETARDCLEAAGVPVVGTDLGGDQGRIVALDAASGVVVVKRAHGEHLQL
jgi:chemotaxis protein CheD